MASTRHAGSPWRSPRGGLTVTGGWSCGRCTLGGVLVMTVCGSWWCVGETTISLSAWVEGQHNLHCHCVLTISVPCTPLLVWLKCRCFQQHSLSFGSLFNVRCFPRHRLHFCRATHVSSLRGSYALGSGPVSDFFFQVNVNIGSVSIEGYTFAMD